MHEIRQATSDDLGVLKSLRTRYFESQIDYEMLEVPTDLEEHVGTTTLHLISGRRGTVLLAVTQLEVIGYIAFSTRIVPNITIPKVGSIDEAYVLHSARGTGIARGLAEQAISHLNNAGMQRIQLRVLNGNNAAKRFWSALGFAENVSVLELGKQNDRPT